MGKPLSRISVGTTSHQRSLSTANGGHHRQPQLDTTQRLADMGHIAQEVHLPHSSGICGSGNVRRGGGGQKDYQEVCFCESGSPRISCADKTGTMSVRMLTWKRNHCTGSRSRTKNYRQFMTAGRRISLSQGPAPYPLSNADGVYAQTTKTDSTSRIYTIPVHTYTYLTRITKEQELGKYGKGVREGS